MAKRPPRLVADAVPSGWTVEQLQSLVVWLRAQRQKLANGARTSRRMHKIQDDQHYDKLADYYHYGARACRWLAGCVERSAEARARHESGAGADH